MALCHLGKEVRGASRRTGCVAGSALVLAVPGGGLWRWGNGGKKAGDIGYGAQSCC